MKSLSYSPSRSARPAPPSQRWQRSPTSPKKPPEPLRRAVADCLSTSAPLHHNNSHAHLPSDASKTLRDYISSPSTCDIAYIVLVEHALAERDRSPAVVPRCAALLKRYLLRYIPKVQTLRQIDQFCMISIVECEPVTNRRVSLWSKSLSQQSGQAAGASAVLSNSTPVSNFASASLVKSLNYVRSLVARHIPKLSFQPVAFSGASNVTNQSLPTLSSLLSKSFTSHISTDVKGRDYAETKEMSAPPTSHGGDTEEVVGEDVNKYISLDLSKWRWYAEGGQQTSMTESGVMRSQEICMNAFLEVGAAALLVGDVEAKVKDQSRKYPSTQRLPDMDELLQPSSATAATNFASSHGHLKAITASKRMKPGPDQVWLNVPVSTFQPRPRPLFQYRYYSEQQPLHLNPAEVSEVIAEICSDSPATNASLLGMSSRLTSHKGQPLTDVAASVLIKLVIDMYMMDSASAAPLTQLMLEDMISSSTLSSRVRAFDLILNLGVHAHLLEPMFPEEPSTVEEEEVSQVPNLKNDEQFAAPAKSEEELRIKERTSSAVDTFESWILDILFEILRLLVQIEEREEIVWASALSCLFYFVCDRGKILRARLEGLDIRVIKTLLEISREHSWAGVVHCKLICMLTKMFYCASAKLEGGVSELPTFLIEQVDLVGGVEFICLEYSRANSKEEKRNLFLILFDYVLHLINEACQAAEVSTYSYDEIQPVISLLTLADAPEAFHVVVKHGIKGMGDMLRSPVLNGLSKLPNYDRLNALLDSMTRKLETLMSTFTRLDDEFLYMLHITKSFKSFASIADRLTDTAVKARLSWATLHSLLHSENSAFRHHGYIWLVELLLSEISADGSKSMWTNIKKFQHDIGVTSNQDLTSLAVPLSISMMCGLLKSKHNFIRWGFLFVLEKLLIRCKFLLDESVPQHLGREDITCDQTGNRLDKAIAVINIMSSLLLLVVQMHETDHTNILKMCDMLFSQLCLRLPSDSKLHLGDLRNLGHLFGRANESFKIDLETHLLQGPLDKNSGSDHRQGTSRGTSATSSTQMCETTSMAALLLRGQAIVPMQLVAHVPESLFYWPLIQLAGAATDDIALGVAVGSKGRGNLPGATSDIRAAILLLLIGKCTADPKAFQEVEGEEFFRGLLDDTDSRVAYYSSAFLLKRMMTEEPEKYQRMLQSLIFKAQQSNNEKLLENPYLQMRGILQLSNDMGVQ